ncbi:ubiquitin thiolesterase [Puccinia graminis f. sp. tritici CRL 75-36-700-3]|uniref:Saccharopine dehydrogenase [NAD(+), L-lysine-forming] n=1 Tax=Puccinia graminis f. sp. tritici (strain CRL 75-36-700-3 / race SCCL) TaxID=418459 RepID=E3KRQ5_PUCGT|nr:ubiquitin thiolesterase [Puccinia graminis f. sp. tritici CRL 75-36-700-3]EFP86980.1 ubiquitin thiolesterase [Puccinia graminis f. sp. tritici CRL 75-36-700-3]
MSGDQPLLWLRCETKPFEHRSALTPLTAKKLIDAGFKLVVERDPQRFFADDEFAKVGCELVEHNSWPKAPSNAIIIGLKELPPNDDSPLIHTHVMFGHCYKQQAGYQDILSRFKRGGGTLLDMEFLQDEHTKRRVAAFGFHAGFNGSAVGLLALGSMLSGEGSLKGLKPFKDEDELITRGKKEFDRVVAKLGRHPKALVIGSLGRCGSGAVTFFKKIGLNKDDVVEWDMAETAKGGPFQEILEADIFINCIYLSSKIPSFVTRETIAAAGDSRQLRVVVDVSCDTTNPNNPIPIYDVNTTFDSPTVPVQLDAGLPSLEVCSIDHLPTLLPREASEQFSNDLLPTLLQLKTLDQSKVWTEARDLFHKMVNSI